MQMRLAVALVIGMSLAGTANAACYDTPGGMTVCPPVDDHLGHSDSDDVDQMADALAEKIIRKCTANPGAPVCMFADDAKQHLGQ